MLIDYEDKMIAVVLLTVCATNQVPELGVKNEYGGFDNQTGGVEAKAVTIKHGLKMFCQKTFLRVLILVHRTTINFFKSIPISE